MPRWVTRAAWPACSIVALVVGAAIAAVALSGGAAAGGAAAQGCVPAVLAGPRSVSVAENDRGRVAAYAVSPGAGCEGIGWSVAGPDAAHFVIDAPAGVLRLRTAVGESGLGGAAADFEDPRDADGDNTYEVTVAAAVPGGAGVALAVAVTVVDVDEPGSIVWSGTRPRVGEPLTATLADPDTGGPDGADGDAGGPDGVPQVQWRWERSAGPNAWAAIEGATAASYTPTAGDSGEFLRVTARYGDRHGAAKTVAAGLHNVVVADVLTSLAVSTGDSAVESAGDAAGSGVDDPWAGWRGMRPAFEARTLHYSVGCGEGDTMALRFAAADADSRLAVDGVAYPNPGAGRPVTAEVPVDGSSDVVVSVSNSDGAETRYVVHCLGGGLAPFTAAGTAGATEQLLLAAVGSDLLVLDANGVVRRRIDIAPKRAGAYFRFYPDVGGEYRWSYSEMRPSVDQPFRGVHVILDESLEPVGEAATAAPLANTGTHDFRLLPGGDRLLMAFEEAVRDYSHLTFPDSNGQPFSTETASVDSAVQIVSPDGQALLTWNSFDHMALEDCTHHWFPPNNPRWAHVNSVGIHDGQLVASFRGCNRVLGIDPATGEVLWRVGPTNQHHPGWASPRLDPAPLEIVGDPQGQFCGQHAAQLTAAGRLLLYDNGANCSRNPWTGDNLVRPDRTYSRAVEYHLDHTAGEAVWVREHSLGGTADRIGWALGHVEPLEGGDWLISWGSDLDGLRWPEGSPWPVNEAATATQVDPATGAEQLTLHWQARFVDLPRVTAAPAWALTRRPRTVTAELHAAARSHSGPADRPQVVVTFSRPVADFAPDSPSLAAQGATVASVAPRAAAGEPAHAYTVTLAPHGDRPVSFALLSGQPCHTGGICTADATPLDHTPAALTIPPAHNPHAAQCTAADGTGGALTAMTATPPHAPAAPHRPADTEEQHP